jgi:GNAT superfamily N-acetyltransferase
MDAMDANEVVIRPESPESERAQSLLRRYFDELAERSPSGFDAADTTAVPPEELRAPHGAFLVAWIGDRAVGCGAVRMLGNSTAEVKRMWLDCSVRGKGLGRTMLAELEQQARHLGCRRVRLDTSAHLLEAIALYRSSGYEEITPYNDNSYADLWFEKTLADEAGRS